MPSSHRARALRAVRSLPAFALLCAAPHAHAACTGLATPAVWAAGSGVRMVIRADFDRDGVDDLATANASGAALSVLLGTGADDAGDGAFAAAVPYASGSSGMGLATGDFDGDGDADLAVAVSTGVAIWSNLGAGTFAGGGIVAAGSNVRGVAVGDFDRDGDEDLAIASSSTNALVVLRNDGGGTFAVAGSHAVGTAPTRVACADLDGDGRLDLACTNNSSGSVSVLRGDGAGGFAAVATCAAPGSPWGLAVLDANADGRPDLLVSNGAGSTLTLLRNDGGGAFGAAGSFTTPLSPRDLAVADFDGDGVPDVAAACAGTHQVAVLRGTGGAFAAYATHAAGTGAASVAVGDFNHDGAADLACANSSAGTLTRWLGTCPAAAGAVQLLAPNGGEAWWPGTEQLVRWSRPAGVAAVDVELSRDDGATWMPLLRGATGDRATVLATGTASERMRLRVRDAAIGWRRDGSDAAFALCGLLRAPLGSPAPFAPTKLAVGDLDGDGRDDVLATGAGTAAVLRGVGGARFAAGTPFALDASARACLADADGDGVLDVVALGAAGLEWRAGDGAGGFGPAHTVALAGGVDLVCGDFDADGIADAAALVQDAGAPALVVRTALAGEAFAGEWRAPLDAAPRMLASADFDADGIADLAVAEGDELEIWRGTGAAGRGDARFVLASTRALPGGAGDLALGDFDRDGMLDVAACALATGDLYTVSTSARAPAAAELGSPVSAPTGETARSPVVADFDGDGRADVAFVAPATGEVRVLAGTASGFAAPRAFAGGGGALVSGDFDGDGATDLLVARPESLDVACLRAMCATPAPATLELAARHAGERWSTGFARRIAWSRSAAVAAARVELSRDGGTHWAPIAAVTTDSALTWIVTGPATAQARVRVCDAATGATRADVSGVFEIREVFVGLAGAGASGAPGAVGATGAETAWALPAGAVKFAAGASSVALVAASRALVAPLAGGAWQDAGEDGARGVALADCDGDGRDDLVTLLANFVSVRLGRGDGSFGDARMLGTAGANAALVAADLDQDGRADLAVACGTVPAQRLLAFRATGATEDGRASFAAPVALALPAPATALARADVNGDGITDLVAGHTAALSTLLGNGVAGRGDGSFRLASTRAFGAGALVALACADLDGDGAADVAAADAAGAWLAAAGNGTGAFSAPVTLAAGAAPRDVLRGDFDRDGRSDLALGSDAGVTLLRGTGRVAADAFARAAGGALRARALALRDRDGDGVADLWLMDDAAQALRVAAGTLPRAAEPALDSPAAQHPALGATLTLHWNGLDAADLDVSYDGGGRWIALARAVQGGTWRWHVHGPVTGLAQLRVRDAHAPARGDTSAAFAIAPDALGVDGEGGGALALAAPWPNPSRGRVTLAFALPGVGPVTLEVCDLAGRRVRTLHRGTLAAGRHAFAWDGRGEDGAALPPGAYFAVLRAAGTRLAREVVLTR